MKAGDIFKSNRHGDVEVLAYEAWHKVKVKFLNTGYVRYVRCDKLQEGKIRDPYSRTVHGIGYRGEGKFKGTGEHKDIWGKWAAMIRRCYGYHSPTDTSDKCYEGVTVCEEWHNYQNFAQWYMDNGGAQRLHLDKDKRSGDQKIYSPSTCCFLEPAENVTRGTIKVFSVEEQATGEIHLVVNMAQFCQAKGIKHSLTSVPMGVWREGYRIVENHGLLRDFF
jgi:hypothetical protein